MNIEEALQVAESWATPTGEVSQERQVAAVLADAFGRFRDLLEHGDLVINLCDGIVYMQLQLAVPLAETHTIMVTEPGFTLALEVLQFEFTKLHEEDANEQ